RPTGRGPPAGRDSSVAGLARRTHRLRGDLRDTRHVGQPPATARIRHGPSSAIPRGRAAGIRRGRGRGRGTPVGAAPDDSAADRTVGCYVNPVGMAVEVAHALRTRHVGAGRVPNVVMVCGQVRPADLKRLPDNVLSLTGNPAVDVLLTTQSLEVGVDLDLA